MSTNKRASEFDPQQADKTFYDLSTRIRGIKGVLSAVLDLPCMQTNSLSKAIDMLMLADDNLAQVVEIYDGRQELNFVHLTLEYRKHADLWPLLMDLLAHAADLSTDKTWHEKAIDFCNRITHEAHTDDRAALLRVWIDLISARGLKICRVDDRNGEKIPLIGKPVVADIHARYVGARG